MLSHVAIDGRLITGQNPTSTVDVATALVKSLLWFNKFGRFDSLLN